jgi:AcrR family transcriptional regulator
LKRITMNIGRGRPRTFATDDALDMALHAFWKKGFQNTRLSDLTDAMGINKPSLYAAFGDKQALYLSALTRYIDSHLASLAKQLLAIPNGREAVQGFLISLARLFSDPALPGGCFIVTGAADCADPLTPDEVRGALQSALQANQALLAQRLERAQKEGELPAGQGATTLARFFMSTVAGMSVLSKNGADAQALIDVVDTAMKVWPDDGPVALPAKSRRRAGAPPRKRQE